jgi:tetratricopeptide (TPR) repeat protein
MSLGLSMIVAADEAKDLERCLKSVGKDLFDDIAILVNYKEDVAGARDTALETVTAAKGYTDNVALEPWTGHFGDMRNKSWALLKTDYIMWLDADDLIKPDQLDKLLKLKPRLETGVWDIVVMEYIHAHDVDDRPSVVVARERIARRCREISWHDPIHEHLNIDPHFRVHRETISIDHYRCKPFDPERNLSVLRAEFENPGCSTRIQFYYGKELFELQRYDEGIPVLERLIESGDGFRDNLCVACIKLAAYYFAKNDYNRAINYSVTGIYHNPSYAEPYVILGDVYRKTGDSEGAILFYKEALAKKVGRGMSQVVDCYGYIPAMRLAGIFKDCPEQERYYLDLAQKFKNG